MNAYHLSLSPSTPTLCEAPYPTYCQNPSCPNYQSWPRALWSFAQHPHRRVQQIWSHSRCPSLVRQNAPQRPCLMGLCEPCGPFWQVHLSWICVDVPSGCGRDCTRLHQGFFFDTSDLVRFNPIWFEMVWNWMRYGPKYLLKKNVNTKLIFYLVLVSNFRYCILIYEHHVIVMYSLYYLLLLLNWCMFTIIWKKNG